MFPALANESNLEIAFSPGNNPYGYDVIIGGRPTQVKTLFSYYLFPTSELEARKQRVYLQEISRIRGLYNRNQITWDLVKQEIIRYVRLNGMAKINDALRQNASIVILDGTRTIPGLLLDYYYTDDAQYTKISNSFTELMKIPPSGFMNVMFASTAYDTKFRISSLVLKVPIRDAYQADRSDKI
jgi:hypothetical protein